MNPANEKLIRAIASEKLFGAMNDPYASEVARRVSAAWIAGQLRVAFTTIYRRNLDLRVGELWLVLAVIALEDKRYGGGRSDSIRLHPMMETTPELDVDVCRRDTLVVAVARDFQAAYATMGRFSHTAKASAGYSSFERNLKLIDQPEDLWVVLAKVTMILVNESFAELFAREPRKPVCTGAVVN